MTVFWGIVAKKLIIFGAFLLLSSLFTATGEEIYSLSQLNYNLKKLKKEKIFVKYQKQNKQATQPTDRKEGWSEWQTWDNFSHD